MRRLPLGRTPAMLEMAADLALGHYPSSVYGRPARPDELPPIFIFHKTEPDRLEALLSSLHAGGYRTLTCDEYLALARGEADPDGSPAVMLSFDDGVSSVRSVAWPLFRHYGMRAVVFLMPGRIPKSRAADVCNAGPLCTWDEIREMHSSGVFDFQSHTLRHHRVFVNDRLRGFVTPAMVARLHPHDLLLWDESVPVESSYPPPSLGAPLYASQPRMLATRARRDDPGLRAACTALVTEAGGEAFFDRPDWRRELSKLVRHGARSSEARWETAEQRDEVLVRDLGRARAMIEKRLPGKRVRHLAWPWGVAGEHAVRAARTAGYEACFWGKASGTYTNRVGGDPMRFARIGEDFVRRLPGPAQVSLMRVLFDKARRRPD